MMAIATRKNSLEESKENFEDEQEAPLRISEQ